MGKRNIQLDLHSPHPVMNGEISVYKSNPKNVCKHLHKNRGEKVEKNPPRYTSIRRLLLKQTTTVIYQCDETT